MKKKILILALCLMALFACLFISVSADEVYRGDTLDLVVTLPTQTQVQAGAVDFSLDETVFEVIDGDWLLDNPFIEDFKPENRNGVFAFTAVQTMSGDIFKLTVKVKDTAPYNTVTKPSVVLMINDGTGDKTETTLFLGEYTVLHRHDFSAKDTSAKYLKNEASCTSPATYFYRCALCDAKGTETFTDGNALAHTYDREIAKSTFLKTSANCQAAAVFYKSCVCGAKGTETFTHGAPDSSKHDFGGDLICDRCGFSDAPEHIYSSIWTFDATGHWHACKDCGAKADMSVHSPNGTATEKTAQDCSVCGYILADRLSHEAIGDWQSDASSHWHDCKNCDDKIDLAAHTYDGGVITKKPSGKEAGERLYTCTVCGATMIEAIAKAPKMLEKPEEVWTPDLGSGLTFRSEAPFAEFIGITIDDEEVPKDLYTVREGSTVVELSEDLLSKLENGEHTLRIRSECGDAVATFEVQNESDGGSAIIWIILGVIAAIVVLGGGAFVFLKMKKII